MRDAPGPRLPEHPQHELLALWQERLALSAYRIDLERVSPYAVCDESCRVGHSLVGVVSNHRRREATIFHTRKLTHADVVHELLHVKHPDWSEALVNATTDRIVSEAGVGRRVRRLRDAPHARTAPRNQSHDPVPERN